MRLDYPGDFIHGLTQGVYQDLRQDSEKHNDGQGKDYRPS